MERIARFPDKVETQDAGHLGRTTLQEILSQPDAWLDTLENAESAFARIPRLAFDRYERVYFVGSGSSYYLGATLASLVSRRYPGNCMAIPSCEVLMFPELYFNPGKRHLVVVVSRSGKSTEALLAAERVRQIPDCDLFALTCHEGSPLLEKSDFHLVAYAGQEKSVVMTRSFTSMLLLFGLYFLRCTSDVPCGSIARDEKATKGKLVAECDIGVVKSACEAASSILEYYRVSILDILRHRKWGKFVFLGSGPFYGIAREAALKLEEMAIAQVEAYHLLEYRHGPKSTADASTLVTCFIPFSGGAHDLSWETSLLKELKGYKVGLITVGARTPLLGTDGTYCLEGVSPDSRDSSRAGVEDLADLFISLTPDSLAFGDPKIRNLPIWEWLSCCLAAVPAHLLGFSQAILNGMNPDRPRNLSQVVELGREEG